MNHNRICPSTVLVLSVQLTVFSCQTHELKTQLAGSIARAAAVFSVDEIIIFNDSSRADVAEVATHRQRQRTKEDVEADGYTGYSDPTDFLYHVLSYLETPPYLRRALFPMHPNLRSAGALPSLDMPHHLRTGERNAFREGVSVRGDHGRGPGTWVDCGVGAEVWIEDEVAVGSRLTLQLGYDATGRQEAAEAVGPEVPREEGGFYWGYSCRVAASLSAIFTESPFEDGYDVSFGTSERGKDVGNVLPTMQGQRHDWQHMVVVFGGVAGLEAALTADVELQEKGLNDVSQLFDHWVNVLPGQGSRTIRTEEAVWVGLTGLRQVVTDRAKY